MTTVAYSIGKAGRSKCSSTLQTKFFALNKDLVVGLKAGQAKLVLFLFGKRASIFILIS